MSDDINLPMLMRIAKSASYRATSSYRQVREDIEQELIIHVLERPDLFNRYVAMDAEMGVKERENKLYVSLVRHGSKLASGLTEVNRMEGGPIFLDTGGDTNYENAMEQVDGGSSHLCRIPYKHTYEAMTEKQILDLLPLVLMADKDIPQEHREKVGMVRNAIYSTTKAQQEVLSRLAMGMTFKEIAADLGITVNDTRKRFKRARLPERCDTPVFMKQER